MLHVALHVPHAPHLVSEEWLVLGSQVGQEIKREVDRQATAVAAVWGHPVRACRSDALAPSRFPAAAAG